MNLRYKIAPQMKDYDRIATKWLPYLMYFHAFNYSSDALNTDSRGFRVSYKDSKPIADFKDAGDRPVCLFVGGSTAFGVGATSDRNTIPSILNVKTDCLWLNFAGRAFSSTQEFILFILNHHHFKRIRKILIFSGINNLLLYFLSQSYSRELGSFFFQSQYNQAMEQARRVSFKGKIIKRILHSIYRDKIDYSAISPRDLLRYIPKRGKGAFNASKEHCLYKEVVDHDREKEDLLYVLDRDIANWRLVADTLGIELYYILQPFSSWLDRRLSSEEEKLFAELDRHPQNHWKIFKMKMGIEQYRWFLPFIKKICLSHDVRFFDANQAISDLGLDAEWLYIDRVHLTDQGNQIVVQVLGEAGILS